MADAPTNPYSAEAQGQAQIAHEQQQLAEAYQRGLRGIESQPAHQQNQALIQELLGRQEFRRESGQTYLHQPVRTRVVEPAPAPAPPAPAPRERRPRLVVGGEVMPWLVRGPVDPETPGQRQMLDEMEQLDRVRQRALGGAYKTPDEWKQLQAA
jgi:hypothetical protein